MIYIIVAVILSLDQISKFLAIRHLFLNQSVPIIKGFFHFTLIFNRGAAFGILKGQMWLFVMTSVAVIILIYRSLKDSKLNLYNVSLAFILGGALGNLIDRLSLGYVVDFLDFRIWPVFNIADSAITVGAILLGWSILVKKDNKKSV